MFYPAQIEVSRIVELHREGACINTIACVLQVHKSRITWVLKIKGFIPREKPLQDRTEWAFARIGNFNYD